MGRSQRHLLWEQGSTAAGEIHAQGMLAPGIAMQVDPSELNTLKAGPPLYNTGRPVTEPVIETDVGEIEVPIGGPGGPLSGSSLTGAIPESIITPPDGGGPDPLPGEEPVLNSINPSSARIGSADVVMNVNGNRFTETSVIYFNGGAEATTFVNDGQLRTTVKPSTAEVAGEFPVWVQQGSYKTAEKMFEFLDSAAEVEAEALVPPFSIIRIEDDADGIALIMPSGTGIHVGDTVLVEATGNTSINGSYVVYAVKGTRVIVDNDYVLESPVSNKGRVTVTVAA